MIKYFKSTILSPKLKRLASFERGCWIEVLNPTPREIKFLTSRFKLNKRNLNAGLDPYELVRFDEEKGNFYIFSKVFPDVRKRNLETCLIVIGSGFFLTLTSDKFSFSREISKRKISFVTTQRLKCLIKLLSLINGDLEKVTLKIVKRLQKRLRLKRELDEKGLASLIRDEELLNELVGFYSRTEILYERILRRMEFFEEDRDIIEDLLVEISEGFNLCKSFLKTISNLREYHLILLSNRLNKVITLLTIFTILFSIAEAISGIYGMNIALPFQQNPSIFYYLLLPIPFIWLGLVFYLKKKKVI